MPSEKPKPITIVAGFGRCGSSLVMQMLAAGGMPTPYSEFPSYEIRTQNLFLPNLYGGAIKVLDPHINKPPEGHDYRFIWLDRDPMQQARSMAKFFAAVKPEGLPDFSESQVQKLAESFRRDRPKCQSFMFNYTHRVMKIRFEDILADPMAAAARISVFCGMLNTGLMAAQVRPRGPECLPYLMEFEQMVEAWEAQNG